MDSTLLTRLNLLLDAGNVDEDIIRVVGVFVKETESELGITLTEDNGSMFVTHIAMALARMRDGEEIMPIDNALLGEEVTTSPIYPKIPTIIRRVENQTDIKIPEAEYGYVALHLCALYVAALEETND